MSKNLAQVYAANPVTTIGATDLYYTAVTGTTDGAITGANLIKGTSPLSTKGDLYTYSTVNTRLAVGTTNGQVLQVASGAATGLAYSTAAYPTVATSTGSFIYADGTNYVASTSLWPNTVGASGKFILSNGTSNGYSTSTIPTSAGATVGKVLASDGTNYVLSTAAFPVASAAAGKIMQSDGTNWVASSATWPTAATNGKFVIANGTNYLESTSTIPTSAGAVANKVLLSDGTNYVLSTPTFPNASATTGKITISDGTNWIASTPTFANTYAVSTILYASSADTVTGLATTNRASLSTNATGVPTWLALTDGQIVIGSSAGAPAAATISAGTGISVTNASNSITVASNGIGSLVWNDVSGTSQAAAVNNGYIISNAAQTTVTLPATAAEGSVFGIAGKGAAGWILKANTGQTIHFGSSATTSAGTLTSTNQWDSVQIVCVTANTTFTVIASQGVLTVA